jgi:hypothetical protein
LKLAIIKSMSSNEVRSRHHNFHYTRIRKDFPQSDCRWMMKLRSTWNLGFCLYISRLILPIKPVFFRTYLEHRLLLLPSVFSTVFSIVQHIIVVLFRGWEFNQIIWIFYYPNHLCH